MSIFLAMTDVARRGEKKGSDWQSYHLEGEKKKKRKIKKGQKLLTSRPPATAAMRPLTAVICDTRAAARDGSIFISASSGFGGVASVIVGSVFPSLTE